MNRLRQPITTFLIVIYNQFCFSQDNRAQYPNALKDSYISISSGYINYDFSNQQLQPGFGSQDVRVPHGAIRIVFGHQFNKYISAQITYLRPFAFVEYKNVNGNGNNYEVGMNIAAISVKTSVAITKRLFMAGEAGPAIVTRGGFIVMENPGVKDAVYGTIILGGGIDYQINNNWTLALNSVWAPGNRKLTQPATFFAGAGFYYTMRELPGEKVERNTGFVFKKHTMQIGYTTGSAGYGVNDFVSKDIHIFWGGAAKVKKGISVNYSQNIFHTRRVFSIDIGATLGAWQSKTNRDNFYSMALYPMLRFTALRSKSLDLYFNYSFAGPAFISKAIIDGKDMGGKFTFQDFMGVGVFAGKSKSLNGEIRIAHFSNGNILPQNNGVMVPLTFILGYAFE